MKIAILSDIHGNSIALDAVLADIKQNRDVDAYWVLGDLTALGFDPAGVIERVRTLPNCTITLGNADRYTISDDYPPPFLADVEADISKLKQYGDVQRSFAWTKGMITQAGHYDWLASLPSNVRLTLPCGTRVLGVHASPGTIDGPGLYFDHASHPQYSMVSMMARLQNAAADMVVAGHVHWPMNQHVGDVHVVVTGGIGNPFDIDRRAKYAILDGDEGGYAVTHHYIPYNYQAHIDALIASHHPSMPFLMRFARGKATFSHHANRTAEELKTMMPPNGVAQRVQKA